MKKIVGKNPNHHNIAVNLKGHNLHIWRAKHFNVKEPA
jgi:hypothetical protein